MMTSKERAELRAKANTLDPIIQIGKEGITDNLITQIDDTLDVRELIKIRVHLETAPKTPKELANELAPALDAEVIQVIGGVIVLWREADEARIMEKKKKRGSGTAKATAKKKVKIKGMRARQREKEQKNPYAVYDRPRYRNDRDKKQGRK
ncbi:MAG: ribosome assembly RNA-binding protein YhbY [Eubacterium sp.]|nr:ribosome assembly RNA-binding protein YhbY [Eubacterium sp.]